MLTRWLPVPVSSSRCSPAAAMQGGIDWLKQKAHYE
jgi:hypothetical protein